MRTVVDADDRRYLLVEHAGESSLAYDPRTGEEVSLPNETVTVEAEPPLVVVARALPDEARESLPVAGERTVGLLAEIERRGPEGVRTLLAEYTLCESDLHGALAELRAAGLVEETSLAGERGYRATDRTREVLSDVR